MTEGEVTKSSKSSSWKLVVGAMDVDDCVLLGGKENAGGGGWEVYEGVVDGVCGRDPGGGGKDDRDGGRDCIERCSEFKPNVDACDDGRLIAKPAVMLLGFGGSNGGVFKLAPRSMVLAAAANEPVAEANDGESPRAGSETLLSTENIVDEGEPIDEVNDKDESDVEYVGGENDK